MQQLSISKQQPESLSTADAQLVQLLCPPVQLKGDDDDHGSSITEVLPGRLYLGTAAHAHDESALNALSISVLVNCAAEITNPSTSRQVCNARLQDQNNYPIADFFDMFFHAIRTILCTLLILPLFVFDFFRDQNLIWCPIKLCWCIAEYDPQCLK
jgi:hypothetical protein